MNKFSSMHTSHIRKSVLLGFLLVMPVLFNSTFLIFLFFIRYLIGFQLPFAFFCSFEFSFSTLNRNIPETNFYPHIYIHFYSYSQGHYQRFESNGLPFSLMFSSFLILYSEHAIYLPQTPFHPHIYIHYLSGSWLHILLSLAAKKNKESMNMDIDIQYTHVYKSCCYT